MFILNTCYYIFTCTIIFYMYHFKCLVNILFDSVAHLRKRLSFSQKTNAILTGMILEHDKKSFF